MIAGIIWILTGAAIFAALYGNELLHWLLNTDAGMATMLAPFIILLFWLPVWIEERWP